MSFKDRVFLILKNLAWNSHLSFDTHPILEQPQSRLLFFHRSQLPVCLVLYCGVVILVLPTLSTFREKCTDKIVESKSFH